MAGDLPQQDKVLPDVSDCPLTPHHVSPQAQYPSAIRTGSTTARPGRFPIYMVAASFLSQSNSSSRLVFAPPDEATTSVRSLVVLLCQGKQVSLEER